MNRTIAFDVGDDSSGRRLDEFLAQRLSSLSRMRIASLLASGACVVNGIIQHAGRRLQKGDSVEITVDADARSAMTPENIPLDIVFEDDQLLVVDKPAGLLVHPTRTAKTGTLANALAYYLNRFQSLDHQVLSTGDDTQSATSEVQLQHKSEIETRQFVRPGMVHRLDRATSGLILVAKTQRALSILARHFNERRVEKLYVALVEGCVESDEFQISAPIARDPESRPQWRVSTDGKQSETQLRVIERKRDETLVELVPLTGRTNQLRVHCSHMGHPIVGDQWYGSGSGRFDRLCLHAARLGFFHPSGRGWMELVSPAPFR